MRAQPENEKALCARQTQLANIIRAQIIKHFRDFFLIETSMVFQGTKFRVKRFSSYCQMDSVNSLMLHAGIPTIIDAAHAIAHITIHHHGTISESEKGEAFL
jgi:hypothetical protein